MHRITAILATVFLSFATVSAFADPEVKLNSLTYDASSRRATIVYTLTGGPAAVTLEILTNKAVFVASASAFAYPMGRDMNLPFNRKIDSGTYKVYFQVDKFAPGFVVGPNELSARVSAWADDNPPLYMGIDLTTKSNVVYYASREAIEGGEQDERWKTTWMLFRRIPAKGVTWLYSSGRSAYQEITIGRLHYVSFTKDFYAAVYEMTQAQWKNNYEVGGVSGITSKPEQSHFKGFDDSPLRPAESMHMAELRGLPGDQIDWPSTEHQVRAAPKSILGVMRKLTGVDVDLPTEAEWEYASRSGHGTKYWFGTNWDDKYGWVSPHANGETHPVGMTEPNDWGLYDMYGNVYELCLDWTMHTDETTGETVYDYPLTGDDVDPKGYVTGARRVIRGGTFNGAGTIATSIMRGWTQDTHQEENLGCRLFAPAVVK